MLYQMSYYPFLSRRNPRWNLFTQFAKVRIIFDTDTNQFLKKN